MDFILTCQGSDYTKKVHFQLRASHWNGFWIDAASILRTEKKSTLVLDPINLEVIKKALALGQKDFIGSNCTVSLMLMSLGGLFKKNLVEWLSSMTYQAASGAGAKFMKELIDQMYFLSEASKKTLHGREISILEAEKEFTKAMTLEAFPKTEIGYSLAGNLLPWIDRELIGGQSKEEWKGEFETNKILMTKKKIPIDGICVRVALMRCHSQAFTIKLKKELSIKNIEEIIKESNRWVCLVENTKKATLENLTPAKISGTLEIAVGRIRKLKLGSKYIGVFNVGDQLLWGAAEPLRRVLNIIRDRL